MTVTKENHIQVISFVIDTTVGIKGKEILIPNTSESIQFSLILDGHSIGVLRVETDEQFNELFEAIKALSFYKDFNKIFPKTKETN